MTRDPYRAPPWKHWAWAAVIGAFVAVSLPFQTFEVNFYWATRHILNDAPWCILFAFVFLAAIAIVDASAPAPSLLRYAIGALFAGLTVIAICGSAYVHFASFPPENVVAGRVIRLPPARWESLEARRKRAMLGLGCEAALQGILGTFIFLRLRNSRRAAQALADTQLERAEANRRLLESRLAAVGARVDPEAILRDLESVQRVYEKDPERADALLDELIASLRRAIPRLRGEKALVHENAG